MHNKHSSDSIAEDLIRAFTQVGNTELHTKTLLEKRVSEIENGMIEDEQISDQMEIINELKEDLEVQAQTRRELMLYLYRLYGEKGNKEYWCVIKHLSYAMYTTFEAYQASNKDEELFSLYLQINKMFIKALSQFLGVTITECSACFGDILKAEMKGDEQ